MNTFDAYRISPPGQLKIHRTCALAVTVIVSVALTAAIAGSPAVLLILLAATLALLLAVRFPEICLALFVRAGMYKGDPRLASLPFDLTVAMGALVAAGILVAILRKAPRFNFPKAYIGYGPLVGMMLLSLIYTPDLGVGLEKTARFIFLTGMAVVAPFFLLNSEQRFRNFLFTFLASSLIATTSAFAMLGGSERLIAPSGGTIELGVEAVAGILIVCYLILPYARPWTRILFYPVIAILLVGLVGSGARSATISLCVCIVLLLFLYPRMMGDLAAIAVISAVVIASASIPYTAVNYLGTLTRQSAGSLLDFRLDLMKLGWELMLQHPLLGVGIGGYPYFSPNPGLYNWAHNLFLEIGSEMGLIATAAFTFIFAAAFRETIRQVRQKDFPFPALSRTVLALLVLGFITILNTGDINNNRSVWLYLALPFALSQLRGARKRLIEPVLTKTLRR